MQAHIIACGDGCFHIVEDAGVYAVTSEGLQIVEGADDWEAEYRDSYNAVVDALGSVLLAHAFAGLDVLDPRYGEGLELALKSWCDNNIC